MMGLCTLSVRLLVKGLFLLELTEGLYRTPPTLGPGPATHRTAVAHHRRLGFAALSRAPLTSSIAGRYDLTIHCYVTAYNARGNR
jgi:hypothetical protein